MGGTITGKSYEVPAVASGFVLTNCTGIELRDIDIGFSRDVSVSMSGTSGRSDNCRFGRCGNLNGQGKG